MRKLLILIPALLIFAGCATTEPQMKVRYVLDSSGNLQQQSYLEPGTSDNRVLETLFIVGLGIVGLYFVGEVFDVWDDDSNDTPPPAQPANPLVPVAGQTSWSTDFIQPVYQPVNQPVQLQEFPLAE